MGLLAYLKTQFVVHLLIGFVFVVSGLVINFTQLCTLALWPISKQLYRRINCRLAYSLWSRKCLRPQALCKGSSPVGKGSVSCQGSQGAVRTGPHLTLHPRIELGEVQSSLRSHPPRSPVNRCPE